MDNVMTKGFCELNEKELSETDGGVIGAIIVAGVCIGLGYVNYRTCQYIANTADYEQAVSGINAYNQTVTSGGRPDLVKPYPDKPTW